MIIDLDEDMIARTRMLWSNLGNEEVVNILLNRGTNIDFQDDIGRTALMKAVIDDNTNIVNLLIKKGANIYIKDKFGKTASSIAQEYNNVKSIVTLNPKIISEQNGLLLLINYLGYSSFDSDKYGFDDAMETLYDDLLFLYERGADFYTKVIITIKLGAEEMMDECILSDDGESALDLLMKMDDLPDNLEAFKEKLILEQNINHESNYSMSL